MDRGTLDSRPTSELTIDELAREGGITTRCVRFYQRTGLLPPPRLAGRVGLYGAAHLERLRLIAHLKARRFSLAAIGTLLNDGESINTLLDDRQRPAPLGAGEVFWEGSIESTAGRAGHESVRRREEKGTERIRPLYEEGPVVNWPE